MESGKTESGTENADKSTSECIPSDKKTPNSLKPKRKIVKKSSNSSSTGMKDAKITQVQIKNEDTMMPVGSNEGNKSEGSTGKKRILTKASKEKEAKITPHVQIKNEEDAMEPVGSNEGKQSEGSTGKRKILTKASEEKEAKITPQVQINNEDAMKPIGSTEGSKSEGSTGKKRILTKASKEKEAKITPQVQIKNEDAMKPVGTEEGNKSEGTGKKRILTKARKVKKLTSGKAKEINKGDQMVTKEQKLTTGKTKEMITGDQKGNKEQIFTGGKTEEINKGDQEDRENLGGLIFMCNSKTKPDCFRYNVLGVTANKQELVMSIKPGLKLFLYDYEQRVMYGIYEASSGGGMKLEPAAFGGSFPVQVRFKVNEECAPLPESAFKKAMKENYDEKTRKFKTYLTVQQVKSLSKLFRDAPRSHSNAESSVQKMHEKKSHRDHHFSSQAADMKKSPRDRHFSNQRNDMKRSRRDHHHSSNRQAGDDMKRPRRDHHHISSQAPDNGRRHLAKHPISPRALASSEPLFLSEKEYRSYGLRPGRHVSTHSAAHASDLYNAPPNDGRNEPLMYAAGSSREDKASIRKESIHPDPFFPSEKEYRVHGLKPPPQEELPKSVMPNIETASSDRYRYQKDIYHHPYHDDTTSLVERYLSMPMPMPVAASSEPYSLTMRGSSYMENDTRDHPGRMVLSGADKVYNTYATPPMPSDYNQKYYNLGSEPGYIPVSSRYSSVGPSAGPSAPYR